MTFWPFGAYFLLKNMSFEQDLIFLGFVLCQATLWRSTNRWWHVCLDGYVMGQALNARNLWNLGISIKEKLLSVLPPSERGDFLFQPSETGDPHFSCFSSIRLWRILPFLLLLGFFLYFLFCVIFCSVRNKHIIPFQLLNGPVRGLSQKGYGFSCPKKLC